VPSGYCFVTDSKRITQPIHQAATGTGLRRGESFGTQFFGFYQDKQKCVNDKRDFMMYHVLSG
jgi:hypothetical protein